MSSDAKYFDYLPTTGDALQKKIGREDLVSKIAFFRRHGEENPDAVVVGCRTIVENVVDSFIRTAYPESARLKLVEKIELASEGGLVTTSQSKKIDAIRQIGNKGAHNSTSVKVIDAQMTLELLDDLLRSLACNINGEPQPYPNARVKNDSMFQIASDEEASDLRRIAKTAALLSGDKTLEKEAQAAVKQAGQAQQAEKEKLDAIADILERINQLAPADGGNEENRPTAEQQMLFEKLDATYETILDDRKKAQEVFVQTETRIREILSEHDFVAKLLRGAGHATDAQFEVMAFPRNANATSNTLQISGGAGTGKTLCLLAKLIADTKASAQASMFEERKKKGLFVCFNKGLAQHIRSMLSAYPEAIQTIEVTHYDEYINQLVRTVPKQEFEHLKSYSKRSRYPSFKQNESTQYWKLIYDNEALPILRESMLTTAKTHPEKRDTYYLDPSTSDNLEWVYEEIQWLESRYKSPVEASKDYLKCQRTGRGSKRRPNSTIRAIILSVWKDFRTRLSNDHNYTIEQATKRLLDDPDLPQYDAIAIDEVQDFSISSIRLLLKFRRNQKSKVYISGDENQKIYQRDFTWKELGENVKGYTVTLRENKRNSPSIESFSNRLLGADSSFDECNENVYVIHKSENAILRLIRNLNDLNETTVVIGRKKHWQESMRNHGIDCRDITSGDVSKQGAYAIGYKAGKGLEFDNVIIDYYKAFDSDEEIEARLLYVACTRARKRLYIIHQGNPPTLLRKLYNDFL